MLRVIGFGWLLWILWYGVMNQNPDVFIRNEYTPATWMVKTESGWKVEYGADPRIDYP